MTSIPHDWHRLVLFPRAPHGVADAALAAALAEVGLAGPAYRYGTATWFRAGARFLDLVVFLGCSPAIELNPVLDADGVPRMDRFCHVRALETLGAPRLWVGDPRARPRCPRCRATLEQAAEALPRWVAQPDVAVVCAACGARNAAAELAWRRAAGYARSFVEIGGIHPHEAVPADGLLAALEAAVGGSWDYFYAVSGKP